MDMEAKIRGLPTGPGVYMMKGASGAVLYIGKAKNLRARVRSYFRDKGDGRYSVRFLVSKVRDIDCILTANEKEALLLEDTLLKTHKPRYNIRLKDSKTYVSIKITLAEKFPRILVVRGIKKDGSRYFGPYISARAVRDTIKFLRRIFPLRVCSPAVFRNRSRPCLDYQLGLCAAPAVGLTGESEYRALVDGAMMFLDGRNTELARLLKKQMRAAAERQDFEAAAALRDRIAAIEEMLEEQKVVAHRAVDQDVFALARGGGSAAVQVLFIRGGRLVGGPRYFFKDSGLPAEEILSSFLTQFYGSERYVPGTVLLPVKLAEASLVKGWLDEKKGRRVELIVPARGDKLKLVRMAQENAEEALRKRAEGLRAGRETGAGLKARLRLRAEPSRIEAFDISNIGGRHAVGAMVVFVDGEPVKDAYRRYRIRGVDGPDDYAMMHEVLSRRYSGASKGKGVLPDLILMDGGKGQLNIALKVLESLGIEGVEVASLAKDKPGVIAGRKRAPRGERVYRPGVKDPILLKEGSRPDLLLRRVRDEVHRFAVAYHRRLRSRLDAPGAGGGASLADVPGIGPARKRALLVRFGGLAGVLGASVEELVSMPGITEEMAVRIKAIAGEDRAAGGKGPCARS